MSLCLHRPVAGCPVPPSWLASGTCHRQAAACRSLTEHPKHAAVPRGKVVQDAAATEAAKAGFTPLPTRSPHPGFDLAVESRVDELANLGASVVQLPSLDDRITALDNGTVDWVVAGERMAESLQASAGAFGAWAGAPQRDCCNACHAHYS